MHLHTYSHSHREQRAVSQKVLNAKFKCLMNFTEAFEDSCEQMTCPALDIISEESLGILDGLAGEGTQERDKVPSTRRQESRGHEP